jgi:hypothetical protein
MDLEALRQSDPEQWVIQTIKQREEQRYSKSKALARRLLRRHNAEDLIPMLGLEEEEE